MNKAKVLVVIGLAVHVLVFPAYANAATPTISNVAGTIATGQTITISGSNMVNDNSTNWLYNATQAGFEGDTGFVYPNYNADGWGPVNQSPTIELSYDSVTKIMGNYSCYFYNETVCQNTSSCGGNRIYRQHSTQTDMYYSWYVRYSGTYPSSYLKFFISSNGWYFQPHTVNDAVNQYRLIAGGWGKYATLDTPINKDAWHHLEIRVKSSSPQKYTFWHNGTLIADLVPTGGGSLSFFEVGIPNYNGSGPWIKVWIDRAVASTSRIYPASKIEVSNNSTYGLGTVKWQEPVYLSDTSVQVKLDFTGLGGGPYYLWVTNNTQQRSAEYLLSGGGEAPTPPSGFRLAN